MNIEWRVTVSSLFDKTTSALGTSLNMRLLRSNITSANIANAETPGYAARKVDFESQLARALQQDEASRLFHRFAGARSACRGQGGRQRAAQLGPAADIRRV